MEKNIINPNNEPDQEEDDDLTYNEKELMETEYVDLNPFEDSQNIQYLIYGQYGHASAYLKVALYDEIKTNSKSFKGKFMQYNKSDKKPKKLIAELYQFNTNNNKSSILILPNKDFNIQNYKYISDFILNKFKVEGIVLFKQIYYTNVLSNKDKEVFKNKLFYLKNTYQNQSNQLIPGDNLPLFNGATGFISYMYTKSEFLEIPCVVYICSYSEYEVCLSNISVFDKCGECYSFLKDKLDNNKIKNRNVSFNDLVREYNSYKSGIFS